MNFKITKRPNPRAKGSYLFHASPFYSDELTILDLAKDISDGCTLNVTDVEAADISCKRIVLVPCSEISKEIESTAFSKVNVVTESSLESSSEETDEKEASA